MEVINFNPAMGEGRVSREWGEEETKLEVCVRTCAGAGVCIVRQRRERTHKLTWFESTQCFQCL